MIKKIIITKIFIIILFCSTNILADNFTVGTFLPDKKAFNYFINGLHFKLKNVKIVNLFNSNAKVDAIFSYEDYLDKAKKFKKPIFALVDNEFSVKKYSSPLIKEFIILTLPVQLIVENSLKILKQADKAAVLVHNKKLITQLTKIKSNKIKIFYVKNVSEVPFKVDRALRETDALIAIPDKLIYNYFSIQFILKKSILSGKPVIGYCCDMIELGAYASIIPDFYRLGEKSGDILLKFFKKKKISRKILTIKKYKIIKNRNLLLSESYKNLK